MRYYLPSDSAITWSPGDQLRVGGTLDAVLVPDDATTHDLIDALRVATSRIHLNELAERARSPHAMSTLAALLTQCEVTHTGTEHGQAITVRTTEACEPFAQLLVGELSRRDHRVTVTGSVAEPDASCRFVIDLADRATSPQRYLPVLARDLPHALIVRDSRAIIVGPIVVPGITPCLRCYDLGRTDAEPEWLIAATQLLDLPAPARSIELELIAALQSALLIDAHLRTHVSALATVPNQPGTLYGMRRIIRPTWQSDQQVQFHSGCGCQVPQESARDRPSGAQMTGAVVSALA